MWELKRPFLGGVLTLLFLLIRLGKYYDLFFCHGKPSFIYVYSVFTCPHEMSLVFLLKQCVKVAFFYCCFVGSCRAWSLNHLIRSSALKIAFRSYDKKVILWKPIDLQCCFGPWKLADVQFSIYLNDLKTISTFNQRRRERCKNDPKGLKG